LKLFLVPILCAFVLCSCSLIEEKEERRALASVGDEYLFHDEVIDLLSYEGKKDSLSKLKLFVDNWVKEQLLLQKALDNLPERQSDFEEQLENYKKSLLIYTFENQIVRQKLDTNISDGELRRYFKENKENFKTREELFQAVFVSRIASAPENDSLKYWLFKDHAFYNEELIEYCAQFASSYHLDTVNWIPLTKIKELVNFPADKNLNLTIGKNSKKDSLQHTLIYVFKKKEKGDVAPFIREKGELKSVILNKRKIELITNVKQEIFEAATLKEEYEVFE